VPAQDRPAEYRDEAVSLQAESEIAHHAIRPAHAAGLTDLAAPRMVRAGLPGFWWAMLSLCLFGVGVIWFVYWMFAIPPHSEYFPTDLLMNYTKALNGVWVLSAAGGSLSIFLLFINLRRSRRSVQGFVLPLLGLLLHVSSAALALPAASYLFQRLWVRL
jgi:hypothetical protein